MALGESFSSFVLSTPSSRFTMKSFVLLTLLITAFASPLNQHSKCECEDGFHLNISTSPFTNIMNVRIDTPEAIFSTPPVVVIGKKGGDILRCRVDNPKVCEVLFNTGANVYSLIVTGEYIFAGSYSGTIHRCNLIQKTCKIYLKSSSHVESLTSARGYVYAGLFNGTILRCQQDDPTSCRPFQTPGSHVYSVIVFNDKIYAGLWEGQFMSCSLRTENNCTLIYTMTAGIMGFSTVASALFAVTWDGRLWNCTRISHDVADFCASMSFKYSYPRDLAFYNGVLYTLENEKGVYTCQCANNTVECTNYGDIENALSMAFAYGTYEMQSQYMSEDTTCKWQRESQCPPVVTYYNGYQRGLMEVHVNNGKLYNSLGKLIDTSDADEGSSGPAAIFAMGADGTILLSNLHKTGLLHTSSFFAGNPVSGAGEMVVKRGVIKKISACSEHYQSDLALNGQVIQSLRAQGYSDPIESRMCGEDEE